MLVQIAVVAFLAITIVVALAVYADRRVRAPRVEAQEIDEPGPPHFDVSLDPHDGAPIPKGPMPPKQPR